MSGREEYIKRKKKRMDELYESWKDNISEL